MLFLVIKPMAYDFWLLLLFKGVTTLSDMSCVAFYYLLKWAQSLKWSGLSTRNHDIAPKHPHIPMKTRGRVAKVDGAHTAKGYKPQRTRGNWQPTPTVSAIENCYVPSRAPSSPPPKCPKPPQTTTPKYPAVHLRIMRCPHTQREIKDQWWAVRRGTPQSLPTAPWTPTHNAIHLKLEDWISEFPVGNLNWNAHPCQRNLTNPSSQSKIAAVNTNLSSIHVCLFLTGWIIHM